MIDPIAQGWKPMRGNAMPGGLGIPFAKRTGSGWRYALQTTAEHANPGGLLHGGVIMAFADHCLGLYVWEAANRAPNVTIQLNTHFLAAAQPGAFLELHGEVTRATRGLVFIRGTLSVEGRDIAAVDGIWRVLKAA